MTFAIFKVRRILKRMFQWGSGSRIMFEDQDRGSGSRIGIKDQNEDDCQENKIANLPSSPFTDEWCDVGTNTFWWAISAFLRALTLPLSSMCTRIVSFQPNHCYINVGIISISYKLHKLDDSLFLGWSTDSLRLTFPISRINHEILWFWCFIYLTKSWTMRYCGSGLMCNEIYNHEILWFWCYNSI